MSEVFLFPENRAVPGRTVIQGDALEFLNTQTAAAGVSVVTSLPDVSEFPRADFAAWREWFIDTCRRILRWLPEDGVAIFFQSDIRQRGVWVDKGYLVQYAAELEQAHLLWHRIVCRKTPGTPSLGRPSYSHLLCLSATLRAAELKPLPDVLPDAGHMPWSRAMGVNACRLACEYLKLNTPTRLVLDPFCGQGTLLAVANAVGLDAVGVELSAKRCRAARRLVLT